MPIRYIPLHPEPIQGQALLNNIPRTARLLRYRDAERVVERVQRGLPLHETQLTERVGLNPTKNLLLRGECLTACAHLKAQRIQVDLVYIDPPFASGADYAKQVFIRRNPLLAAKLNAAAEQLDNDVLRSFEEKMYGDIWNKEDYLNWMYENLVAIRSIMTENASIYLHIDSTIGHYVKVLMDEVFGDQNFQREIIWDISVLSGFKTIAKNWIRGHDTIFYYTKNDDNKLFNKLMQPHTEKYLAMFSSEETAADGTKRKYLVAHGLKRYLDEVEAKGKPFGDVWGDIMSFQQQPTSAEKVDYATQKPEALLERIISASSHALREDGEPMVVADFFGGSGVTAAVAQRLGRRFVHVDVGVNSLLTARDRLRAARAEFDVVDIQDGVSLFRNPVQTMDKLRSLILGLRNEDSLPNFWEGAVLDATRGLVPVYLPNLLDHTTRVLDVPLLNRVLHVAQELPDAVGHVIIYYIDLTDRAALDVFIRDNNPTTRTFELRDLKPILDQAVVQDEVSCTLAAEPAPAPATAPPTPPTWRVALTGFSSDRLRQKIDAYNQKKALTKAAAAGPDTDPEAAADAAAEAAEAAPKPKARFVPLHISDEGLELIEFVSVDATGPAEVGAAWQSDAEIKIDKKGFVVRDGHKTTEFWDGTIGCAARPVRLKVRNIAGDETIVVLPAA